MEYAESIVTTYKRVAPIVLRRTLNNFASEDLHFEYIDQSRPRLF